MAQTVLFAEIIGEITYIVHYCQLAVVLQNLALAVKIWGLCGYGDTIKIS